MVKDIPVL